MNCKGSLVEEWNLSGPILHELEDIFKIGLPFRQVSCCFSHRHQGNVPSCGLQWERSMVLGSTGLHAQKRWRMNFSFASWRILIKAP